MNEEKLDLKLLHQYVKNRDVKNIRLIFEQYAEIDIAEEIKSLDVTDVIFIVRTVKSEYAAELFANLPDERQEELIAAFTDSDVERLVESGFADDIVDYLEDMPANLVSRVLKNASPETRSNINALLNYKADTAGSIMTIEYIAIHENITVAEALEHIRKTGKKKETVYTIFVTDRKRNLIGTLDLDDLVFAEPTTNIDELINHDYQVVHTTDDQESVANLVRRYNLYAVGVLNSDEKLSGVITIDDIVDVISEEGAEDITRLGKVAALQDSYLETPVFKLALKCLPWLIILIVFGVFSTFAVDSFQVRIAAIPVLSAFIPMVMGTGGNSANQSIALMIRGLSLEEFKPKDYLKILWKEVRVSLIVSSVVGVFVILWVIFEMYVGLATYPNLDVANALTGGQIFFERFKIAGALGLSLFVTVNLSKIIGVSLPLLSVAIKKDPALASGPIATTIIDILSLVIYLGITTLILSAA